MAARSVSRSSGTSELIIAGTYRIVKKIGSADSLDIHLGVNIRSGEEVAVKLEPHKSRHQSLIYEAKVCKLLEGGVRMPRINWYGSMKDNNVMVMDLLGQNLEELFQFCSHHFTMKTVLMLAIEMIDCIQQVHRHNFIHGDIKPQNFRFGIGGQCNNLFITNFGLAKRYKDSRSKQHIPYCEGKGLTGTARYVSINTHRGIEMSRRDDLESLGYVLMYFNRSVLPWQNIKATTKKQKYERICEAKRSTRVEVLCAGFPEEFAMYIHYCRGLRFEEDPDYAYLSSLFTVLFTRLNYEHDYVFDWTVLKQKVAVSVPSPSQYHDYPR